MSRIKPLNLNAATGKTQDLLNAVKSQLGGVPNIFLTLAQSPVVLEAFLNFNSALGQGTLSPAVREQIALTVAGKNHCDYCASAHTVMGKGAGISDEELEKNLVGESEDSKTQAALNFSKEVVENRGGISDASIDALRTAGYGDDELIEIIAHIAINTFTNYFNRIAQTEIDFPVVSTTHVAKAA